MKTVALTIWGVAAALAAAAAHAETFYDKDGVQFEGTLRKVVSQAGVCNVLEEKYSEAEYEKLKANQDQPLDLWRVDFSIRNGSGRGIDYLNASSWVLAEYPPCTNWSGPERAPLEASVWVVWGDHLVPMQMPHGMRAGQEKRRAVYLMVFHEHRPTIGEWDIDYTFAREASAGRVPAGGASSSRQGASAPADPLPPDIVADRYLRKAEQAVRDGDIAIALLAMERLEALQREHGLESAPEDHYRHAQAWEAAGEPEHAMESAVRYLRLRGRDAEHYTEALDLMNRAESGKAGPAAGVSAASRVEPGLPQSPRQARTAPAAPPSAPAPQPRAGQSGVFDGMEFAWIPAGDFRMGSTSSDASDLEQPVTRVRISRGFWLGKHEVTQAEWQAVMGTNPSRFSGCGRCPVEEVSWEDAQAFIGRLNARGEGTRYRLPTEAEWEYAARAGTSGDRYGNLDAIAWHDGNSGDRTHPVGQKAPNAFGLHDMLGNVFEWVQDWYGGYPGGSLTDPRGPASGSRRVLRGGGWPGGARFCRASNRSVSTPGSRLYLGFRLLRTE